MVVESSESSLFLKRNLCWCAPQPALGAETLCQGPEQVFEEFGGAMGVRVRQIEFAGPSVDAQMDQLAQRAGQAVADFAQRVGMGKLTEEHGRKLCPTREAFGLVLRPDAC